MASRAPTAEDASLFSSLAPRPLADRIRPDRLTNVVGQDHLLGPDGTISRMLASGSIASMIFWGPPGCGKTTIARLLADEIEGHFEPLSAVFSGVADLKKVFETARKRHADGTRTVLFVDEIHRFNRAQQDAFLPVVEDGTITLVGATTENPSFELNPALLSRARVFVLNRLDADALEGLLKRAEQEVGPLPVTEDGRQALVAMADGDGRYLISLAEALADSKPEEPLDGAGLSRFLQRRAPVYDKAQDSHYNLISALHKSLRASDVDAALYWFARMIDGGEDPLYVARRLVRFASEDIGMADPQAMVQALGAWDAYERLGSPEGELSIAQSVIYLATAPKSNAAYVAYKAAVSLARSSGTVPPPPAAMNAPTRLMKHLGYGEGYAYDHDSQDGFSGQNLFPKDLPRQALYQPVERGFERDIQKRLAYWARLREERSRDG
ncbi:MAG: replication-associated recombination protein A [Pseudomonadota bacterium]